MFTKLRHEEVRRILDNVDLPGSAAEDLKFALASKTERRKTIVEQGTSEQDVKTAAAIEIQRVWRGYHTRCKLFGILHPSASVMSTVPGSRFIQSPSRLSDVRTVTPMVPHTTPQPSVSRKVEQISARALPRMEKKYNEYCENAVAQRGPSCKLMTYTEFCAVLIQEWWRSLLLRPVLPRPPPPTTDGGLSPAGAGQQRGGTADTTDTEGSERKRVTDREEAAKIIQRSWRQHIDVQVYRYYRDLINFKCRGDPSSMLKCINPREAELLDAAAGVHIKFRLAGEKFPPNIYYKIFTHHNIVDMCANAPRDYTRASTKRLPVQYIHNKGQRADEEDKLGWYQRWENNGWRLVSDRVMKRVDQDPVVYESTLKKELFSHNKQFQRGASQYWLSVHLAYILRAQKKYHPVVWDKKIFLPTCPMGKGSDTQVLWHLKH